MSSPIALQELFKAGFEDFVVPTLEVAPYTLISNRAKVTRSLKAIAGSERIVLRGILRLPKEFGANGEFVWESEDRDSRIRFVGNSWAMLDDSYGMKPWGTVSGQYIEVTFYGTGLAMLTNLDSNAVRDWRVMVDGGAEGTNIYTAAYSNVLGAKGWNSNQSLSLANNLTLGWHTVRIKTYNTGGLGAFGFDVLNERTDIGVYAGSAISKGNFVGTSALLTSSFKDGVTGVKGARVVKYIQNGALKSAVQMVDATALYVANADHTNEEIVRQINWREFGVGNVNANANDFSLLNTTGTARAFPMEDGVTNLVGGSAGIGVYQDGGFELLGYNSLTAYITFEFEGTGLDLIAYSNSANSFVITIDGASAGSVSVNPIGQGKYKVASGLPYGTHTCKIMLGAGVGITGLMDFLVYQPKKPSIPDGCSEVADYCVVADYAIALTEGLDRISTGVIRNHITRGPAFVGTWTTLNTSVGNVIGGWTSSSTTLNSYIELNFWGTGVDYRLNSEANQTQTISIDGSSNLSALTTTLIHSGALFTPATGAVTGNGGIGGLLSVRGLTLGWHKIRVTLSVTTGGGLYPEAFDIITPIRSNDMLSGQSIKSTIKYSPASKRKIQRKAFNDTLSGVSGPMATFVNLTIGKAYRITGYAGIAGSWNGTNVGIELWNGTAGPSAYIASMSGVGNLYITSSCGVNTLFVAKASSILIVRTYSGPQVNCSASGVLMLEEVPDADFSNFR